MARDSIAYFLLNLLTVLLPAEKSPGQDVVINHAQEPERYQSGESARRDTPRRI